jgi:hypothetical protein
VRAGEEKMPLNEEQKQLARDFGYDPNKVAIRENFMLVPPPRPYLVWLDELEFLRTVRNIVANIPGKIPDNVKLRERGNDYRHHWIHLYYDPDGPRRVIGCYGPLDGTLVFETPSRVKLPLNGLHQVDIEKIGGIIKPKGIINVPISNKDIISMMIRKSFEKLPNL